MYGQVFDRELGGANKHTNRGHRVRWQTPKLSSEMFLERLETASCDKVNLNIYCQGLPIVCQFGRAGSSHLCAVTDEDGQVSLFNTQSQTSAQEIPRVQYWQAHNNAVFDYTWISGDSQCLTASGDQTVALWDVNTMTRVTTFIGHNCSVRSVAACPGNVAQCASGARDGHIMLWDLRVNKKQGSQNLPVKAIKYAHSLASRANLRRHRRIHRSAGPKGVMDTQQSVTCVLYQTDNLLISSGANDGCVKLWDTRKWYTNSATSLPVPLHTFNYPGHMRRLKGIVTMCMDPWRSQLFVSYTDNTVYRYELIGTYRDPQEYVYAGHRNDTFFVRCAISPDGRYLLSGSGRNTGVIWEVDRPEKRPVFLVGHMEDVSAVDWCPTDLCKLVTLSDDMSLRIWRPDPRERNTEDPTIVGYAYSASSARTCSRQAQVHIIQDEFPFFHPASSSVSSSSTSLEGQSPAHSPTPSCRSEPSMRQVFWASCHTLRRSPRKLNKKSLEDSTQPREQISLERGTSCPSHQRLGDGVEQHARGNGDHKLELREKSPQLAAVCGSSESSLCIPKNKISSPLPFSSYALRSALRLESVPSPSDTDTKQHPQQGFVSPHSSSVKKRGASGESPSRRTCPRRSPRKLGLSPAHSPHKKRPTPVKGPKKLLTPSTSPPTCGSSVPGASVKPRRQLFSSPTAALPNSVVDPPHTPTTPPPPVPTQRKMDWLTSYRLARRGRNGDVRQEADAGPSSTGLPSEEQPDSSDKESSRNSTPQPGLSSVTGAGSEEVTPAKRRKVDRPPTPQSTRKRSSFSKPGGPFCPPRCKPSAESPKTPTNMSIKRYLQ